MSLFMRVKRMVKSDAYAFVEGLEAPRAVLAQALRDMEAELAGEEAALARLKAESERLAAARGESAEKLASTDADIDLAVAEKRPDIAKALIRRMLALKAGREASERRASELGKDIARREAALAERRARYEAVKTRAASFGASPDGEGPDGALACAERAVAGKPPLDEEVELEFLKRLKARGRDESRSGGKEGI